MMELPPKSMVRVWSVLSVTLYVTCRFGASLDPKRGCPSPPCRCEGTLYYCDNAGLDAFPHHLIATTTTISLSGLSLRHNRLLSVPEGALSRHTALQWLLLGHSRIQRLGERSFLGLCRLKELELSANHLRLLPNWTLRPLRNLRLLDLSSNRLSALSVGQFRGLRKLAALRLRGNRLASLPVRVFRDLRRLRHLDLGENQLQTLARNTFEGLIRLTELRLDQNRLSRINLGLFARLTSLHTLDLSQNLAAWLSRTLHWYWPTLEHLDLSQNQLEWLEPNAFHGVPHLKSLLLHSNRLQVLELGILNSWVSVENLTLSWNPWDCGPSVCALAAWLVYHRGRQWDNGPLLCALPHKAAGENILDAVHAFQTCQSRVFDFHTAETNTSSVAQVNNRIEMDTAVLTGIVATTTTETEWYFVTEMTGNGLNEKESGKEEEEKDDDEEQFSEAEPFTVSLGDTYPNRIYPAVERTVIVSTATLVFLTVFILTWKCMVSRVRRRQQAYAQPKTEHQTTVPVQAYYINCSSRNAAEVFPCRRSHTDCTCHISQRCCECV